MTNDVDHGTVLRPLGYNEQYELAQYTLDYHRGVSTACRYTIPKQLINRPDFEANLQDMIYGAIARVISNSPTLCAAIRDAESKKPVWIHLASVDLDDHVEWIKLEKFTNADEVVQEKIRSEMDTRFAGLGTRPGWRVAVLQHVSNDVLDVVFTWNHAHTDGMGGKIFHDRLLKALVAEKESEPKTRMRNGRKLDFTGVSKLFPPATESFVDLPTSAGFLLQQAWNETKPTSLFPNLSTARWAPVLKEPYSTKFRTCIVDNVTLSGILKACRDHKTTLTALLHSLVLLSLASQLDGSKARAFASLTAIDQRRFLPSNPPKYPRLDPNTTLANYVTNTTHEFDVPFVAQIRSHIGKSHDERLSTDQLDLVWSGASMVREDIEGRLTKGLKDDRLALMKFVPNARALFEKEIRKPRALSWAISNLGVLDGTVKGEVTAVRKGEEGWHIQRAQFTMSATVPDAALLIAAVSLRGGEFVITCTWQDKVVEDALACRVVGHLKKWMEQIGSVGAVL
ncbi:hypothetical protein P171DRAFT_520101 [Karstenula rhodostoma CBS 690.94]|uniref:Alcohol acetyltransferase n=1 Tax=Karstenula rhodostoma CBS 690.94 TaxID=1392251 RepID=A0A9P4PMB3_9PLEO|nr:hypothetical protein P171DRAFT_520101 [Karstenula rhodostoma CBS 690.94]